MKLKEYIVVKTPTGRIDLWMTEMFEEVKRNNPPDYDNYRIITTFDPGEELKEGGGMKTKEEILRKNIESKCDQTYAVLSAMDEYAAQFAGTREEWISVEPSNPLPGYDEPVLWITESGNQYVDHLDKDEPVEKFVQGSGFTHWRKLPNPPNTDTLKPI